MASRRLRCAMAAVIACLVLMMGTAAMPGASLALEVAVQAQSPSALVRGLDADLVGNNIWASESENAFYYVERVDSSLRLGSYAVRRYDLDTGASTEIESFDSLKSWFFSHDKLYYVTQNYFWGSGSNTFTVTCIDLASGRPGTELFTAQIEGDSCRHIGVDEDGRVFIADTSGYVRVYDQGGAQLAVSATNMDIDGFVGFDSSNGNFYFQGTTNWRYWGYDHEMACLKMGNFTGSSVILNDKSITIFYQDGFFDHLGSAEMFAGRYVADLSTFNSDMLAVLDSNKIGINDVTDTETSILLTGGVDVTTVALPADRVVFGAYTLASNYEGYADASSVGSRAAYLTGRNSMLVATEESKVSLYDMGTGQLQGTMSCAHGIYKLMAVGDAMVTIEKEGDAYCVEANPVKFPSQIAIEGPAALVSGGSADYAITSDGTVDMSAVLTSSNQAVVSVDDSGKAGAWNPGAAILTCTTSNGLSSSVVVTVTPRSTSRAYADITVLSGTAASNWNLNDYSTWSSPVTSSLVETASGLMRVQEGASGVIVEYYNAAGSLTGSTAVALPLPLYGGFFADDSGYYLVSGQANQGESDSVVVMRVTRYDSAWNAVASVDVSGANTYIPFDAGSLRMDQAAGKLCIHTCHEMYDSGDGLHHQANMTFVIDEATMTVVDSCYDVSNLSSGYVSHSFNQFIRVKDGWVYRLDHGDAYPRGIALTMTLVGAEVSDPTYYGTVVEFEGQIGANYTGASVGGFEVSDSHALIAWNQDVDSLSGDGPRNVLVSAVDLETGAVQTRAVTSLPTAGKVTCCTPQLVKVDGRHFVLMWSEHDTSSGTIVSKFVQVDHVGRAVGDVVERTLPLSDCQPIPLSDGSIAWYVSTEKTVKLYSFDPFNLASMPNDTLEKYTGGSYDDSDPNARSISKCTVCFGRIGPVKFASNYAKYVVVRDGSKTLKEGRDYYISSSSSSGSWASGLTGSYLSSLSVTLKGEGAYKGTKTCKLAPLSKKTKLKSVKRVGKAVKVAWAKEQGAAGYRVYRAIGAGKFKLVKTVTKASTTSWKDKKATNRGKKYSYKVKAFTYNAKGKSIAAKASKAKRV